MAVQKVPQNLVAWISNLFFFPMVLWGERTQEIGSFSRSLMWLKSDDGSAKSYLEIDWAGWMSKIAICLSVGKPGGTVDQTTTQVTWAFHTMTAGFQKAAF